MLDCLFLDLRQSFKFIFSLSLAHSRHTHPISLCYSLSHSLLFQVLRCQDVSNIRFQTSIKNNVGPLLTEFRIDRMAFGQS